MVGCVVEHSISPQGLLEGERDQDSKCLLGSSHLWPHFLPLDSTPPRFHYFRIAPQASGHGLWGSNYNRKWPGTVQKTYLQ